MTDSRNLSAALLALLALASCKDAPAPGWSGYAEGDYVYVAAPVAGRLQQLTVQAGDQVKGGAPLFALDVTNEREAAAAAQAQASAAQAQAANLDTGRRPDEIAAIEAQLAQARALADAAGVAYQHHIRMGHPAQAIVRFARELHADEIVMGTHGRTGLMKLVMGSVAADVSQKSNIPVTLVK